MRRGAFAKSGTRPLAMMIQPWKTLLWQIEWLGGRGMGDDGIIFAFNTHDCEPHKKKKKKNV